MADVVNAIKEEMSLENVLCLAMHVPGVKINREKFLHKELIKYCSEEVIEEAIENNPAKAGISKNLINTISKQVINYEAAKVTTLSIAASLPGGVAAVGAATADITSYFAFVLRTIQKLAYLYGFEQFSFHDEDIDSETMTYMLAFMGVMFGVQGAASVLKEISNALAKRIAKNLARKSLTKTAIYPIVKKVAINIGLRMTKQIYADSVASLIPVVGGALSGGLTYAMFKPACLKLRKNLMSYNLCDPEYYKNYIDIDDEEI